MSTSVAQKALSVGLVLVSAGCASVDRPRSFDVVVYGGTSAGVAAAVEVARHGRSVALVAPDLPLGGMSSAGLGATDIGNKAAIGGLARAFYRRVRAHYADDAAWVFERREDFRGRGHRPDDDAAWTFEPHVAAAIFEELVAEAGVEVVRGERLDRERGVEIDPGSKRIVELALVSGMRLRARAFVDATYEGDLLAAAGVSYTVGRESNATYGETLDGVQTERAIHHQFTHPVDPFVVPGDPSSGVLPGVSADPPGAEGSGDRRVQAYCLRLTTTDVPENRRPWPRPDGYDPRRYELLLRNFEAGDRRLPWNPVWMPNRKTDTNNNFAISTDHIGASAAWPEADDAARSRMYEDHLAYTQGLLWALANEPRVPEEVRAHFRAFGMTLDEFPETDGWPPRLYVREARRMIGVHVMTEHHCRGTESVDDPVGLGAYGMDSHHVQRYVTADGRARNEGDVQVHGFSPYGISYRSLVPEPSECTNLLVPVCLSASHIAYGSIRMEPVFMVLGQSAGVAACLAIERDVDVQGVDYPELRERLLARGQVLDWPGEVRRLIGIDRRELSGVVVDDERSVREGSWVHSTSVGPFVDVGYRHDGDRRDGSARAVFRLEVPTAGRYVVRIAYAAYGNRASNARVTVEAGGARAERRVDQRRTPPIDGLWLPVGEVDAAPGTPIVVTISNAGADGHVVIDAVQAVPG